MNKISLILLINIEACAGYKPIFSSSNLEFEIADYSISGDKKIGNKIIVNTKGIEALIILKKDVIFRFVDSNIQ